MSKVITFSRTFPSYHPKAGQPTYFVEKFIRSFCVETDLDGTTDSEYFSYYCELAFDMNLIGLSTVLPKYHTIRAGSRFKVGDKFSPRVWGNDVNPKSGRSGAYHSKQIIIAPDTEVKKVWDFQIINGGLCVNGECKQYEKIAINDGLTGEDLLAWFKYPKPFKGQIICWNENVKY